MHTLAPYCISSSRATRLFNVLQKGLGDKQEKTRSGIGRRREENPPFSPLKFRSSRPICMLNVITLIDAKDSNVANVARWREEGELARWKWGGEGGDMGAESGGKGLRGIPRWFLQSVHKHVVTNSRRRAESFRSLARELHYHSRRSEDLIEEKLRGGGAAASRAGRRETRKLEMM